MSLSFCSLSFALRSAMSCIFVSLEALIPSMNVLMSETPVRESPIEVVRFLTLSRWKIKEGRHHDSRVLFSSKQLLDLPLPPTLYWCSLVLPWVPIVCLPPSVCVPIVPLSSEPPILGAVVSPFLVWNENHIWLTSEVHSTHSKTLLASKGRSSSVTTVQCSYIPLLLSFLCLFPFLLLPLFLFFLLLVHNTLSPPLQFSLALVEVLSSFILESWGRGHFVRATSGGADCIRSWPSLLTQRNQGGWQNCGQDFALGCQVNQVAAQNELLQTQATVLVDVRETPGAKKVDETVKWALYTYINWVPHHIWAKTFCGKPLWRRIFLACTPARNPVLVLSVWWKTAAYLLWAAAGTPHSEESLGWEKEKIT